MIDGQISEAGICMVHKMEKMFMGNDQSISPVCIKCQADAKPKTGRIQTVEDPGEEYFKGKGTQAKITYTEKLQGTRTPGAASLKAASTPNVSLEDIVAVAINDLKHLPMPDDLKQFKKVQKVIKMLQSLVEPTHGK